MTREEAIKRISRWLDKGKKHSDYQIGYIEGWFNKEDEQAFQMAIQALQTEQCEDIKDALHIAQTDRDKWAKRAKNLAKIVGIRDCDIDRYKQEPCDDAISRQAVVDSVNKALSDYTGVSLITYAALMLDYIKALPPVTPQNVGKWITVSEKLPEEGQRQLVLFCDIDEDIMIGYHVDGRPDTHFTDYWTGEDIENVIAWMQLPEPMKEGE